MVSAGTPTIYNIALTTGSETTRVLPANTKKFLIKARETNAGIRLAYASGGTTTTYLTINPGVAYWEDILHSSLTIYLRADTTNCTAEIVVWR